MEMVYKMGFFVSYEAQSDISGSPITNYSFEYFAYDHNITDPYAVATWTVAQSSADPTLDNYHMPNVDTTYLFRLVVTDNCGRIWEADIDDPTFSMQIDVNSNDSHTNTHVEKLSEALAHIAIDYPSTENRDWHIRLHGVIVDEFCEIPIDHVIISGAGAAELQMQGNGYLRGLNRSHIKLQNFDIIGIGGGATIGTITFSDSSILEIEDVTSTQKLNSNAQRAIAVIRCDSVKIDDSKFITEYGTGTLAQANQCGAGFIQDVVGVRINDCDFVNTTGARNSGALSILNTQDAILSNSYFENHWNDTAANNAALSIFINSHVKVYNCAVDARQGDRGITVLNAIGEIYNTSVWTSQDFAVRFDNPFQPGSSVRNCVIEAGTGAAVASPAGYTVDFVDNSIKSASGIHIQNLIIPIVVTDAGGNERY